MLKRNTVSTTMPTVFEPACAIPAPTNSAANHAIAGGSAVPNWSESKARCATSPGSSRAPYSPIHTTPSSA